MTEQINRRAATATDFDPHGEIYIDAVETIGAPRLRPRRYRWLKLPAID